MRFRTLGIIATLVFGILLTSLVAAAQDLEESIVRSTFRVEPGSFRYWSFKISTYIRDGRIAGNTLAAGGAGNDIRVLVLTEEQFQAFRGTVLPQVNALYDSGKRRSIVLSVPVSEPSTYYIVFDNRFSVVSPKNVSADIRLVHKGLDIGRAEEVKRQASERERRIGRILAKLIPTLQALEKELGTHQIQTPIYFALKDDPTPNAFAQWRQRAIILNRGTLEFAESMPDSKTGDDILAGVLAHELAHIFYRHSFGDEPQQQREALIAGGAGALMIHPLVGLIVGALALDEHRRHDRVQEGETDIFGVRLACAAGFDPSGLLTFMEGLGRLDPSQGSFLRDHPSPRERIQYLKGEVAKLRCPSR